MTTVFRARTMSTTTTTTGRFYHRAAYYNYSAVGGTAASAGHDELRKGGGTRRQWSSSSPRVVNSWNCRNSPTSTTINRYGSSIASERLLVVPPLVVLPIRIPEKGTGFDNFIPKDKQGDGGAEKKSDDDNPKPHLKIDLKTGFGGSGGDKNNKNNQNNNNNKFDPNNSASAWMALALALGVSYWINSKNTSSIDNDRDNNSNSNSNNNNNNREIAWSDFLRLLQQQDIQKVVIANANSTQEAQHQARVYLKPHATGLARWQQPAHSSSGGSDAGTVTTTPHSAGAAGGGWDDATTTMPSTVSTLGDRWTNTTASSQTNQNQQPFYYRLAIGSLESFERKLDDAERRLGRSPDLDIPVQYAADAAWTRELWGIVPGVLLALGLYGMMRFGSGAGGFGATGGRGGGGGAGGIFSIGKSTAKKIAKEDVNVTFAQVAGCDEAKREIMEFVGEF